MCVVRNGRKNAMTSPIEEFLAATSYVRVDEFLPCKTFFSLAYGASPPPWPSYFLTLPRIPSAPSANPRESARDLRDESAGASTTRAQKGSRDGTHRSGCSDRDDPGLGRRRGVRPPGDGINGLMEALRKRREQVSGRCTRSRGISPPWRPGSPTIAAQAAYPERQVVAFVGDGGFSMLMAELATCVKYELPVKIVIAKNNTLGQIMGADRLSRQSRIRVRAAADGLRPVRQVVRRRRVHH